MPQKRRVSIIVPVRTEGAQPEVFSCSDLLLRWKDQIEVLTPHGSAPSVQRNLAVKDAEGEYVYFLDDDCILPEDTLRIGLSTLDESKETAATGGPALTRPEAGVLETAIGDAMGSFIGSMMTRCRHVPVGRPRRVAGEEFTLCNLLIRKDVYAAMAGLNGNLHPGEDPEFLKRINDAGHHLYYNPGMYVYRSRRKSFRELALQFCRYGAGRAQHIFQNPRPIDLAFFVPSLFVLGLVIFCIFKPPVLSLLYSAYAVLCVLTGIISAVSRRSARHLALVPLALVTMHVSYGAGLIAGFFRMMARVSR